MQSLPRNRFGIFISALLFFLLACSMVTAVDTPAPTKAAPTLPIITDVATQSIPTLPFFTETPNILISKQVTLVAVPFNESNPGANFPRYTITSQTPQLTGSEDARISAFNRRFTDLVNREVDTWRQNFQQLPLTPYSNGSTLDMTYTLVGQMGDLWSFKFDVAFYADTAAHPGLNSITLTYDLGQGRELALSDLFLPNSNYLEVISKYCIAELGKQPFFDSIFVDGASPTPEHYRNWNLAPGGLQITFDTYQVGPGAAGPQTVLVPYSELAALINPQGPLAGLVP